MMSPSSLAVFALKALQKSMMFTPAWPRAGSTGGGGVAFAEGVWRVICPTTFFMSCLRSEFLHLQEVQLHRGGPAEDGNHDLEGVAVQVDLLHHPLEVRERAVDDAHALPALEGVLRLRLLDRLLDLVEDLVRLLLGEGHGAVAGAHEARDLWGVLDQMPGGGGGLLAVRSLLGFDLDQDVAGEEAGGGLHLLAPLHLHHFLGGNLDAADVSVHAVCFGPLTQALRHLLLEARVGVHDVPLLGHQGFHRATSSRPGRGPARRPGPGSRDRTRRRSWWPPPLWSWSRPPSGPATSPS